MLLFTHTSWASTCLALGRVSHEPPTSAGIDPPLPPTEFFTLPTAYKDLSSQGWLDTFHCEKLACSCSFTWLVFVTISPYCIKQTAFFLQMLLDYFSLHFKISIFMPSPLLPFLLERVSCDHQSYFIIFKAISLFFKVSKVYLKILDTV